MPPPASPTAATLSIVKAQLVFLLSTLTEEAYAKNEREILSLVSAHGADANVHLIRRLILQAAPALSQSAQAPAAQVSQAQLALRLLVSETKRVSRDPLLAGRFRDALLAGLYDPSHPAGLEVFRSFDFRAFVRDRAQLAPLECFVLTQEVVQTLIAGPPHLPTVRSQPSKQTGQTRDIGLAAATLLRECWASALEVLNSLRAPDTGPPETISDLSPIQISKLFDFLLSDFCFDPETGDAGFKLNEGKRERLVSVQQQRDLVRAIANRVNSVDLTTQITMHSLDTFEVSPGTTTAEIIHRICPDPTFCTVELCQAVFGGHGGINEAGGDDDSVARHIAPRLFFDLVDAANRHGESLGVDVLAWTNALSSLAPRLRWADVIRRLEGVDKPLPEDWGLRVVAAVLAAASPEASVGLFSAWSDQNRQFRLFERLFELPSDLLLAAMRPHPDRRVVSLETLGNPSQTIKNLAQGAQTCVWNNLDLIATLLALNPAPPHTQEVYERHVRIYELLERVAQSNPDLLLIALVVLPKPWNELHTSFCARLLHTFLVGHPRHQLVFHRIWQVDPGFLLAAFRDFYSESELNVTRVLDIVQDVNILDHLTELKPIPLSLDVACLAARREMLALDNWLANATAANGQPFVRAILDFVGVKVRYEFERNERGQETPATMILLPGNIVAALLRSARLHSDGFINDDTEVFKDVRQSALQLHPRLMNFTPGIDREPGTFYQTFEPDIEAEGDVLFRQLYDGEASVEDILNLLQRARESTDPRSKNFFTYVMSALYEEKRFFSTYPEKELTLTAQLFGSLIQHNMIEHIPLGIAVRYVLDALKSPPDSTWFRFGVQALSRFHERLPEWPQFAQAIGSISHLQHSQPEIMEWVRRALSGDDEPLPPVNGIEDHQVFTTLTPDPHVDGETEDTPDEETADRIGFIFNNLTQSNLDGKTKELIEKIKPETLSWTARYMIEQRVSIEPNNHKLYIDLLDRIDQTVLSKQILREAYVKSAALLNAEKTVVNSTDRTVLKNLGSWIGLMTLAKNKPILQRNAAFKDLLLQGYDSGRLIVAIPFVCKVLEQAAASRVFKPPNPWLMGIIRLLVELYHFAEIKLNLKFEIEVLCKNLKLELKTLEPLTTVRDRPTQNELAAASAAAAAAAAAAEAAVSMPHELEHMPMRPTSATPMSFSAGHMALMEPARQAPPPLTLGNQVGYSLSLQDTIAQALQTLASDLTFGADIIGQFAPAQAATLRRFVTIGIDRAIREIIAPVVERSVTIAGIATRELTSKDFAMEGDEDRLGKAAHMMVQNLAANLANVTCKDPLRISMLTNVRQMLVNNGLSEALDDTRLGHLVHDNLDVACSIVENVAKEKALLEIDDALNPQYIARRKHRDRSSQPFWDSTAMAATHYSSMLPDALRLKLGGLQPSQLHVYDDFSRIRSGLPPGMEAEAMGMKSLIQRATDVGRPLSPPEDGKRPPFTVQFAVAQVNGGIGELEGLLSQAASDFVALAQLPARHPVPACMDAICQDAASSMNPEETVRAASSKVVQMLYRAETPLAREAYVVILERLCMMSPNVAREVTGWFTFAEDERKLNVAVLLTVAMHGLIDISRFDGVLASLITREWRPSTIDFTARFIAQCLVANPPVATREQLVQALDALVQAAENGKATELAHDLLDDLRGNVSTPAPNQAQSEQAALRERLTAYFVDWVKLFQQSASVEKAFVDFVVQLQSEGVLRGEEISSMFFRVCTEVSIEAYIKNKASGAVAADMLFVPIDSLARLIALLVKYHADPNVSQQSDAAKVLYVNKVLSIVVLVLAQNHEEFGPHFQQKPFFRFFSSMLSNLHAIEAYIGASCYSAILSTLSNQIQTLQPIYFPGFAFSWLSLIAHRLYMPRLLDPKWPEGHALFNKHLMSIMRFLSPFLRSGELRETIRALYFGLLKVLLVLLHDFPDFLATYAPALVAATPASCTQLINIFVSAFPSHIKLSDPFGENTDTLPDMSKLPPNLPAGAAVITMPPELQHALDKVLTGDAPVSQLTGLGNRFVLPENMAATDLRFNFPLLDLVVQHLCSTAVGTGKTMFSATSPSVAVYERLLSDLDLEGRYLLVCAAANLLRWPSAHTRWAKHLLMHVYSSTELGCQEIVTRVLLERLLVARPHPWGTVWAMSALIRKDLISESFVTKHPEITALVTKIETSLR